MIKMPQVHACIFGTLRQKFIYFSHDDDFTSSCRVVSLSDVVYATRCGYFYMFDLPGYSIHEYGVFSTFDICVETLSVYAFFRKQLATC